MLPRFISLVLGFGQGLASSVPLLNLSLPSLQVRNVFANPKLHNAVHPKRKRDSASFRLFLQDPIDFLFPNLGRSKCGVTEAIYLLTPVFNALMLCPTGCQ